MKLKIFIALILLTLFTGKAISAPMAIPPWQECFINGTRYSCYDFEGTKDLMVFEEEYKKIYEENEANKEKVTLLTESVQIAKDAIAKQQLALNNLWNAYNSQTEQVLEEIKQKNEYKYKPGLDLGDGIGWMVVGGLVLLGSGLALGFVLD